MRFSERQELIETWLARDGHVSVPALAKACGVAPETARRDLAKLEKMGLVRRVHGGAIPPTHEGSEPDSYTANLVQVAAPSYREETAYSDKTQQHVPEKSAIARAALELIPSGPCSITIDAGTTTAALAAALRHSSPDKGSTFVTNSMPVAEILSGGGLTGVNVVGGNVRPYTRAIVGEAAARHFYSLRADIAFIAANGVTPSHGFSTPDPTEAAVKSAIARSAKKTVALVDSSKIGRDFLVTFAQLTTVDAIVTDIHAPREFLETCFQYNIKVVTA